MKRILAILALCLAGSAFADTATLANGQTANVQGTNSASIAPNAVGVSFNSSTPAVTATSLDGFQKFETNQAMTAPTIVGGTAPATYGCPAIDGKTGSIAIAQFGTTDAKELPGCMANLLAVGFKGLTVTATGAWTDAAVMQLEAWCDFAQYKRIIERTGRYVCASTREERAMQALNGQPTGVTVATTSDPYIQARLEHR